MNSKATREYLLTKKKHRIYVRKIDDEWTICKRGIATESTQEVDMICITNFSGNIPNLELTIYSSEVRVIKEKYPTCAVLYRNGKSYVIPFALEHNLVHEINKSYKRLCRRGLVSEKKNTMEKFVGAILRSELNIKHNKYSQQI